MRRYNQNGNQYPDSAPVPVGINRTTPSRTQAPPKKPGELYRERQLAEAQERSQRAVHTIREYIEAGPAGSFQMDMERHAAEANQARAERALKRQRNLRKKGSAY